MKSFLSSFDVRSSFGRVVGRLDKSFVRSHVSSRLYSLISLIPRDSLRLSFGYFVVAVFVVCLFSVFFFYLVLVTNWLLSHAVRTLHSCPEEFFDLLPVVSNLATNLE